MDKIILMPTQRPQDAATDKRDSAYLDRLREVAKMLESISAEFEYDLKDTIADTIYLAVGRDIVKTLG